MEVYYSISFTPNIEHCRIDNIGKGTLGIVGDGFSKCCVVIATPKEPTLAASKRDKMTLTPEGIVDMSLPP